MPFSLQIALVFVRENSEITSGHYDQHTVGEMFWLHFLSALQFLLVSFGIRETSGQADCYSVQNLTLNVMRSASNIT